AAGLRLPYSSPMIPSPGRSLSMIARMAASAARSASVTNVASLLRSSAHSPRNSGRIASPAASASRLASAISLSVAMSVEKRADGAFVGDAANGFADQRGDGENADLVRILRRVRRADRVGDDQLGQRRAVDPRHRAARKNAVSDIGRDRGRALVEQRLRRVAQRTARIDDVVDQDAVAA